MLALLSKQSGEEDMAEEVRNTPVLDRGCRVCLVSVGIVSPLYHQVHKIKGKQHKLR